MRKLTVEIEPIEALKDRFREIYDKVESIELVEFLRLDVERGMKVAVVDYHMLEGFHIDDIEGLDWMDNLVVLKEEDDVFTCLMKVRIPHEFRDMLRNFDLDLIWDAPTVFSEDRMLITVMGEEDQLRELLDLLKQFVEIRSVSFRPASFEPRDVLACLTDKQREIMVAAMKHGYFEYPKRINSEELAHKVGVSKSTVVEHLRKAEGRLMENLLAGY